MYAILYFCFVPPLLARALSHVGPPIAALQRRVTALRLLYKKEWSRAARKDLRDRLYKASKIVRENQERQRWLGPSCPALSAAITLLTTYLSQCVALESKFGGMTAKYYQKIAKIMEAFSSPRCLACGVRHSFTDWRRVKARDQYKGVWNTSHVRATIKAPGANPTGTQWDGYPFDMILVQFFASELNRVLANAPS